ncbi:MAG: outer membrane beta-barrel protein [Acidobacteriota bacterium]
MKKTLLIALTALVGLSFVSLPAEAGGISIYGSYWDTEDTGENLGAGIRFGFGLTQAVDIDLRVTYYEETADDPFDLILDGEDPTLDNGIQVVPVEAGLRFNLGRPSGLRPYLGAGVSYYLLETDVGELDDEGGYYGVFGFEIGDESGGRFFAEAMYRTVEATVEFDRDDFPDVEIDEDQFDVDLGGLAVNAGFAFSF